MKTSVGLLIGFMLVLFFQNCGVQKPKVEDMASLSATFSHSPIPTSCMSCHLEARPVIGKTMATDHISDMYFHSSQYNGEADCVACHAQKPSDLGKTWMNGVFNHKDDAGAPVVTCLECHTGNKPAQPVGSSMFDHKTVTQDCYTCHQKPGVDWSVSAFSHSPTPTSCMNCHSADRPAVTSFYPSQPQNPSLDLFVHKSQYGGQSDCVLCHTQVPVNIGVKWAGGVFNHKSDTGSSLANCTECHIGSMPSQPVGSSNFSHATIGSQDCFMCHKNAGGDWSTSAFSHSPVPTSCTSCHNADRPNSTQYFASNPNQPGTDLYVHASAYNGAADCVLCHTQVPANVGVKWAGGNFNHKNASNATVTDCINCHLGNRPASHTSASGQLGDCVGCHTHVGVDWGSTAAPDTVVLQPPTGTKITSSITVKHPTVQAGMSCTTCHSNYNATNSIIGFDHTEGLTLAATNAKVGNTSCFYCHFSPGQVIDTTGITIRLNRGRTYIVGQMVQGTVSHKGENLSTKSSCLDCHTSSSAPAWNTGTKTWSTGGSWNGGD